MDAVTHRQLRRRAEAGHWLLRLQEDSLTETQVEAWLKWAADPENLAEFEGLQSLYAGAQRLGERAGVAQWPAPRPPRRRRLTRGLLAAAATVVLAVGVGAFMWVHTGLDPAARGPTAYATGKGIHRDLHLADGSMALLGASSKLTVDYDERRRRVVVDAGEVYFEVAKDAARPFQVEAGNLVVTAVGTAFNVRRSEDQVEVTVTEGSVDAARQDASAAGASGKASAVHVRAQAGERVTLTRATLALTVASTPPQTAAAWRFGRLEFSGEPLKVVVANLNRYVSREIGIDPDAGALIYSGTVQPDQVDEWLDALQTVFPVRVERGADGTVTLRSAEPPSS